MYMQIENHTLHFLERAQSKCGSLDCVNYLPSGGDRKVLLVTQCLTVVAVDQNIFFPLFRERVVFI